MHSYHEILFYMDKGAIFLTKGGQRHLQSDTLLIIPKETYHFFRLQPNKHFLRMKISIPDLVINSTPLSSFMSGLKVIENPPENIMTLLNKLLFLLKEKPDEKKTFYAYSVLMVLLSELDMYRFDGTDMIRTENNGMITNIVNYISNNLAGDLSINVLSQELNYSPSCITHCFKKELGISLHKYITMRRLMYARNLIKEGSKPSNIYLTCGYCDYSSFYKAYTKFFGYPPSKEKQVPS